MAVFELFEKLVQTNTDPTHTRDKRERYISCDLLFDFCFLKLLAVYIVVSLTFFIVVWFLRWHEVVYFFKLKFIFEFKDIIHKIKMTVQSLSMNLDRIYTLQCLVNTNNYLFNVFSLIWWMNCLKKLIREQTFFFFFLEMLNVM